MLNPDVTFKIHFFLFDSSHTYGKLKFSLEDINKKCAINNLELTKEHCDFLEYQKYLIRNWDPTERSDTGYQQIQSGDAVMDIIWPEIIKKLQSFNDNVIDLILKDAPSEKNKAYKYIYNKGIEYKDSLPILKTILDEYWNYLTKLKVFEIQLTPNKLNVRNSSGVIKVSGTVSLPYRKLSGKIPIRIFYHNSNEEDREGRFVTFVKGIINGAISFPIGYMNGKHALIGYFQLEGEKLPDRYEAYANSGRMLFTISNT